ncbi:MAG: trehalase family glycosidase [Clostridia bacterium]
MKQGIHTEPLTKKEYFTGYSYKCLYDWDQYFEAIVQLYLGWDPKYIRNGVEIFLDLQREEGFIPRSVPSDGPHDTEHVKPFLSQILLLLHRDGDGLGWLRDGYYARLKKYLLHWLVSKDHNGDHLSFWDSGPHTGMDNQHERAGWWGDRISEGVDLNSFLYRECIAFSRISEILGETGDRDDFLARAGHIRKAVEDILWDEADGMYYDRDKNTKKPIRVKHIGCFAPLWAGIPDQARADRMIRGHLFNPEEFLRPFPFPALSKSEPGYSESKLDKDLGCSWRANTWIPTNYYLFHALRKYGYGKESESLGNITYEMVQKIGDREYYTSESCTGCGLDPFWGWSLLAYFMPLESFLRYDPTDLQPSVADLVRIKVNKGAGE